MWGDPADRDSRQLMALGAVDCELWNVESYRCQSSGSVRPQSPFSPLTQSARRHRPHPTAGLPGWLTAEPRRAFTGCLARSIRSVAAPQLPRSAGALR